MDDSKLSTIPQIEEFLSASAGIEFNPDAGDLERYAHISALLKRFDYPQRNKHERGVLLAQTDLAAAKAMQKAKADLFAQFNTPRVKLRA